MKVHLMVGVVTHVVTAAEIHERNTNDSPILPSLLDQTAKNFKISEVSADNQYSSEQLSGDRGPRCDGLHSVQAVDDWRSRRTVPQGVPFLQPAPGRIHGPLPQAVEHRIGEQHDQAKVGRCRPQQNRLSDEERGAVQNPRPQHLLLDSGDARIWRAAGFLLGGHVSGDDCLVDWRVYGDRCYNVRQGCLSCVETARTNGHG